MTFKIWRVNEPNLLFGGNTPTSDPRFGILNYGPYSSLKEGDFDILSIPLGIIGTEDSIKGIIHFLQKLNDPIPPNKVLTGALGFPGLDGDSPFRMKIKFSTNHQEIIPEDILKEILSKEKKYERLQGLLTIFEQKLSNLTKKEPKPTVVLCALSKEMIVRCKRTQYKTNRLIFRERKFTRVHRRWKFDEEGPEYFGDYDFHNVLKIVGMKENLPTQLVHYDTWKEGLTTTRKRGSRLQDPVTLAWNFAAALYYKASGIPWKFTQLEDNTLYLGISFFPEVIEEKKIMRASMAQIFLHTGESFILRGDAFHWEPSRKEKSPHLTVTQAEDLIDAILNQYHILQGKNPKRIVIHKSSNFYEEELAGFKENTQHISTRDFMTLMHTPIKFFRDGVYPPLRGTVISGEKDHYLFTTGYTPTLLNYPGKGTPDPLLVRPFLLDSPIAKICEEILSLTKLDWNNIYYNIRLPVTLGIAEKVGDILSEPRAKTLEKPLIHYRYYM